MTYTPPKKILANYAKVLVNFALGGGNGIKKGDTVLLSVCENAKPLLLELQNAVTKAGGTYLTRFIPDTEGGPYSGSRDFYALASAAQLSRAPTTYYRGLADEIDHFITILSYDPKFYEGIDPNKLQTYSSAQAALRRMLSEKEMQGKLTWTLALYGTPALAREAGLPLQDYWKQIIRACFLDSADPVREWKKVFRDIHASRDKLNALRIDKLHVGGPDADLWIALGEKRRWIGGVGANIPSFEIFCSPDWRGTEGFIRFNEPRYYLGNLVEGIELWFEKGKVIQAKARRGEKLLKEMIAQKNADKVGEFSLTDRRFSRITEFMAHNLYDENVGGRQGNTHIALGRAIHDSYAGNGARLSPRDWDRLGFNDSAVHTDIVSTAPRVVTAYLKNGGTKVIYKNGQFIL